MITNKVMSFRVTPQQRATPEAKPVQNMLDSFASLAHSAAVAPGGEKHAVSGNTFLKAADLPGVTGVCGNVRVEGEKVSSMDLTAGDHRFVVRQDHGCFGTTEGKTLYFLLTREGSNWSHAAEATVYPDGTIDFACSPEGREIFARPIAMFAAE